MFQWLSTSEISTSLFITGILVCILVFCYAIFRLSKKHEQVQHQLIQLQNEIRAINSGNLGMGRKISRFADEIASVEINQMNEQPDLLSEKTFQQAGLLLERGATIEEVVESCEMSPAEVELLATLKHSGAAA